MKVNSNNFWTETIVEELAKAGLKDACISPGSRSTPITMALAQNKGIEKHVIIDERTSGFFALGLSKISNLPTIVVCTSGTAVAELYPAIVEAFYSRIPLLILTADRPPNALNCGSNQTINQENIFVNHIRLSINADLPSLTNKGIKKLFESIAEIVKTFRENPGPIHLNLPFDEPLDPRNLNADISDNFMVAFNRLSKNSNYSLESENNLTFSNDPLYTKLCKLVKESDKVLIIAGPETTHNDYKESIINLSEAIKAPIIADVNSNLRFYKIQSKNVIVNADSLFRSENLNWAIKPDYIIQFGRTITSKSILKYLSDCKCPRYIINKDGDLFDPSRDSKGVIKAEPNEIINSIIESVKSLGDLSPSIEKKRNKWLEFFIYSDNKIEDTKREMISGTRFPIESRLVYEITNLAPNGCRIFLSNSSPIRDFDYFASKINKEFEILFNRGASGIDGIISTALGVSASDKKPITLVIGDQAFQHDISSLPLSKNFDIPITIILINNNGGGIFYDLPISEYGEDFDKYFKVSQNINFGEIVKGFGGYHKIMPSWQQFKREYIVSFERKGISVLEFQTDASESHKVRKAYWERIDNEHATDIYAKLTK